MIKVTDLFPPRYYENIQDFDASRAIKMELDGLRDFLEYGRKGLAFNGALAYTRPMSD